MNQFNNDRLKNMVTLALMFIALVAIAGLLLGVGALVLALRNQNGGGTGAAGGTGSSFNNFVPVTTSSTLPFVNGTFYAVMTPGITLSLGSAGQVLTKGESVLLASFFGGAQGVTVNTPFGNFKDNGPPPSTYTVEAGYLNYFVATNNNQLIVYSIPFVATS